MDTDNSTAETPGKAVDDCFNTAQYIRAVLPTDTQPHERLITAVKYKDGKGMSHYASKDINEHLETQAKFDAMSHADVYTALQAYDSSSWQIIADFYTDQQTGEQKPRRRAGQLNPKRKQEFVTQVKSFWFDIDGKNLPKSNILPLVDQIFDETGFTDSGLEYLAVDSGGGYHIYLPLTAPLTNEDWKPVAIALDNWLTPLLKADAGVTLDSARVLRLPSMRNKKRKPDDSYMYKDTDGTGTHLVQVARPVQEHDDDGNWKLNDIDAIKDWIESQQGQIKPVAQVRNSKPTPMTDGTASKILEQCNIVKHHINSWAEIDANNGMFDDRWQHIMGSVLYSDDAEDALRQALPEYTAIVDQRDGPDAITETIARKRGAGYKYSCNTLRDKTDQTDPCKGCRLQSVCYAKPSDLAMLPDPTDKNVGPGTDMQQFARALTMMGFELRLNTRAARLEYKRFNNEWEPMNAGVRAQMQTDDMQKLVIDKEVKGSVKEVPYQLPGEKFKNVLDAVASNNEADPFKDYLDSLPDIDIPKLSAEWIYNPKWSVSTPPLLCDRIFTEMLGHEIVAQPDLDLTEGDELRWHAFVSRFIPLAAVHRTMHPGCKVDEVPVISGKQGLGKDLTIEMLLPSIPNQDLYTNSFSFKQSEKERLEATNGAVIVAASEMAGVTRTDDVESMKSWITRRHDKGRMAYRADSEVFPRRFIVTCTTNSNQPLPQDATGNRRWLVVDINREESANRIVPWYDELIDDPRFSAPMSRRDIIWTEAKALCKMATETDISLPKYIRDLQERKNGIYEHADIAIDEAWSQFEHRIKPDQPVTSLAVALALEIVNTPTEFKKAGRAPHQVATLMKQNGYTQKTRSWKFKGYDETRRGRAWIKEDHPMLSEGQKASAYEFDYEYFYGDRFIREIGQMGA